MPSMRRPVSVKLFSLFFSFFFFFLQIVPIGPSRLCRHPSIRTLVERFSLGASWAYLIQ